jgi:hypothetical protein
VHSPPVAYRPLELFVERAHSEGWGLGVRVGDDQQWEMI